MKTEVDSLLPNKANILNKYLVVIRVKSLAQKKKKKNFCWHFNSYLVGQLNDF